MKIFRFIIVQGTLDTTEASVVTVEQNGWDFEVSDREVVQEPGSYDQQLRRDMRRQGN